MKFRDVVKGTGAFKPVRFRLANSPPAPPSSGAAPGSEPPADPSIQTLGVRVLTGDEMARVYQLAQESAAARGVKDWSETHPICRVYEMAHTLALACVDIDDPRSPYFDSADQLLSERDIGPDNIVYLFEQQANWQDECSIQTRNLSIEEVIGILAAEAERPENAESPLDRMRPALRRSFLHSTAILFRTFLKANSESSFTGAGAMESSSTKPANGEA